MRVKSDQPLEQGQGRDWSRKDFTLFGQLVNNLWFSSPAFPLGWEVFHQEISSSAFHCKTPPTIFQSELGSLCRQQPLSSRWDRFQALRPPGLFIQGFFLQSSAHPSRLGANISFSFPPQFSASRDRSFFH